MGASLTSVADSTSAATVRLHQWIAAHGPLWPPMAAHIALEICVHVEQLSGDVFGAAIASLDVAHITRDRRGRWSWQPSTVGSERAEEREAVVRIGGLLFHCVTGQPVPAVLSESALRAQMMNLRPDLSVTMTDMIIAAIFTGRNGRLTLSALSGQLRRLLDVRVQPGKHVWRATVVGCAAVAFAVAVWVGLLGIDGDRADSTGLTPSETALLDATTEAAQSFAMVGEHTVAVRQYQEVRRQWGARVSADDPRLVWNDVHESWVRTLADDRLSAEQLLGSAPASLARLLGEHPYVRMARLALAATLDARGAREEAAALRRTADEAARTLMTGSGVTAAPWDPAPVPPGVVAHLSRNIAEREGFRRGRDGEFFAPLTSTAHSAATREGWRLHVMATGRCRVSLVIGEVPEAFIVEASRAGDGAWHSVTAGSRPPQAFTDGPRAALGISIAARASGDVEIMTSNRTTRLAPRDPVGPLAAPPYGLAFDEDREGAGCGLVWLEIPFPAPARFDRASPARNSP